LLRLSQVFPHPFPHLQNEDPILTIHTPAVAASLRAKWRSPLPHPPHYSILGFLSFPFLNCSPSLAVASRRYRPAELLRPRRDPVPPPSSSLLWSARLPRFVVDLAECDPPLLPPRAAAASSSSCYHVVVDLAECEVSVF
jgi:hypothetical protein